MKPAQIDSSQFSLLSVDLLSTQSLIFYVSSSNGSAACASTVEQALAEFERMSSCIRLLHRLSGFSVALLDERRA